MNNRNPFIPNIPTPHQGHSHWGDPQLPLYSQNSNNNNQINGQVPFTAHQQVHLQQQSHQSMYNIGYTTAAASLPLSSMPLQSTPGTLFWDDGPTTVNLNNSGGGGMQMNYSYQNIQNLQNIQNMNSCYQQQLQQHQQIVNPPVVHQIVNQNPRVVPLTLDAPHFVHFPVNLSPTSGMVPLTLNSRSSNTSMTPFSMGSSSSHSPLSLNSRSPDPMSPVQNNSPSPSLQREPLSLNSRSSGSSGGGGAIPLTSRALASMLPQSNTSNSPSPGRMEPLSLNSRSSGNTVPLPRNSRSPASMISFSVNSPSPTPMAQTQQFLNSRPGSSFVPLPLNSRSPASNIPYSSSSSPQSLNLRSPPASTVPFTMNSSSHSLSSRSPPTHVGLTQQFTATLLNTNPRLLGSRSPASMIPFTSMNYSTHTHSPSVSSYNTSQSIRSQQQAPMAHSRAPVSLVNARSTVSNTSFPQPSPSPPSPPPKKKRAPRKKNPPKKTPERPFPINPSLSLPVHQSSSSSLPLNRPSVISSAMNPWSPMLPVSTNISSSNNQAPVVTTVSTSWTNRSSASTSMLHMTINPFPLVPTPTSLNSPSMMPLSTNRLTPLTSTSTNPSLVVPTAITSSQMMVPTSSPRSSPMVPSGPSPRPPMSVNSSPPKSSSLSVLDYALERAGIPSSSGQNREAEANTEVFREEEILQLVGEIPDQSTELQMLNPSHEISSSEPKLKSDKTNGSSINCWEQDAFTRTSGPRTGDEDLEFELQRFYCPPSPPKEGNNSTSGGAVSTSTTTSTTGTTVTTNASGSLPQDKKGSTQSATSKLTLVQGDQAASSQKPKPSVQSVPGSKPAKGAVMISSDDDEIEVLLVKLGPKKKRVAPNPALKRGNLPPKKMPIQSKGKETSSQKKADARKPANPTSSRYITPVEQRARAALSVDPRSKAIARPAYPNGRYVSVAPKTTVPIPRHQTNSKSVLQDVTKPQTVVIKATARKRTGGIQMVKGVSPKETGSPVKPTARKSTAPLPKTIEGSPGKPSSPSVTGNADAPSTGRGKRQCTISSQSASPPFKKSRKTAKPIHSSEDEKEMRVFVNKLSSDGVDGEHSPNPDGESRPPIKLKFSLKESTGKSSKGRGKKSGGKGRKRKSKSSSKKRSAQRAKKEIDPIMAAAKASSSKIRISDSLETEGSGKRDLRKRNSGGNKAKNTLESDDELLIVQEYLADSDESYDPDGERDEASSESESEPEANSEAGAYEDHDFISHQQDEENKSETKAATTDSTTTLLTNINEEDNGLSAETEELNKSISKIENDDTASNGERSPPGHDDNDFAADSPPVSPAGSEKIEDKEESTKGIQNDEECEKPEKSEGGSDESDEEEVETVQNQTVPKAFEMPKPEVVLKGTKAEADKAVADMRQALAQLSKFKIPFFGK